MTVVATRSLPTNASTLAPRRGVGGQGLAMGSAGHVGAVRTVPWSASRGWEDRSDSADIERAPALHATTTASAALANTRSVLVSRHPPELT